MQPTERQLLLDEGAVSRTLATMAQEIIRQSGDPSRVVLMGVQRRGVELAGRLAQLMARDGRTAPPRGALDITLYRDDLEVVGPKPIVGPTHLPCDLEGRHVWIVDDVLHTGRTIRAALDELADFGRPARIGLAVLVDRGGRELPIQADVAGHSVQAGPGDHVEVLVQELDDRDAAYLLKGAGVHV